MGKILSHRDLDVFRRAHEAAMNLFELSKVFPGGGTTRQMINPSPCHRVTLSSCQFLTLSLLPLRRYSPSDVSVGY